MKEFDEKYWDKRLKRCATHACVVRVITARDKAFALHEKKAKAHFEKFSWMYAHNLGAKPTHPPHRVLWDAKYENYSAYTGKPHCRFLSAKLGFRVSAKMRDAIWTDYWNCYERRDNKKRKVSMTWKQIEKAVGFDYNTWRRGYK